MSSPDRAVPTSGLPRRMPRRSPRRRLVPPMWGACQISGDPLPGPLAAHVGHAAGYRCRCPTAVAASESVGKLLRRGGEADPDSTRLLPGHMAIGFEKPEDEATYDLCRDLWGEELRRNLLSWREAPGTPALRQSSRTPFFSPGRCERATSPGFPSVSLRNPGGGGDPRRVLLQGLLHIDEVDRRLPAYITVAYKVAEEPGVVRRYWLVRAKAAGSYAAGALLGHRGRVRRRGASRARSGSCDPT